MSLSCFLAAESQCASKQHHKVRTDGIFLLAQWAASSAALQDLMQTQSFILLNVREVYFYSVRQNTAGAKKKSVWHESEHPTDKNDSCLWTKGYLL